MTLEISPAAMGQLLRSVTSAAASSYANRNSHVATVMGKDPDGTVWVSIVGGAEQTPVNAIDAMVEAEPGDTVSVTIANGRATITGNASSPAATGRTVEVVRGIAEESSEDAKRALTAADTAEVAAIAATESAGIAASAAEAATEAAEIADGKATQAQESADAAGVSASQANAYAIDALNNLSDVEKVVGTLNWIAEHGTYSETEDESVEVGKQYYIVEGDSYIPVQYPSDDAMFSYALTQDVEINPEKTYYERVVEYTYALTQDTEITPGKTYYEQAITYEYELTQDVEIDPTKTYYVLVDGEYVVVEEPDVADIGTYYEQTSTTSYSVVASPVADDLSTYFERTEHVRYEAVAEPVLEDIGTYYERTVLYYELTVEESVQNYIASHLALADDGLNLTADSNKYRAVLASDGLRIIDPQGNVVGVHGEEIQLGSTNGIYFSATSNVLSFRTVDQPIAWFGQNSDGIWEMHIQNTYAEDMVRFGDYAFIKRANGNMSLKWLGDDE